MGGELASGASVVVVVEEVLGVVVVVVVVEVVVVEEEGPRPFVDTLAKVEDQDATSTVTRSVVEDPSEEGDEGGVEEEDGGVSGAGGAVVELRWVERPPEHHSPSNYNSEFEFCYYTMVMLNTAPRVYKNFIFFTYLLYLRWRIFALCAYPSVKGIFDVAHFRTQCPQLCRRFLQKVVVSLSLHLGAKECLCYWLVIQ